MAIDVEGLVEADQGLLSRHEGFDPDLNAWASDFKISESNHRSFDRRRDQLMAAESWTDLQGPPVSTKI